MTTAPHQYSVAMTSDAAARLREHLLRDDGHEDLCFAIWRLSTGATRSTALIHQVVLPEPDDRQVHGNASFNANFFLRACAVAAEHGCGVAFLHSHPHGRGWQGMSGADRTAEANHAAQTIALTDFPLVGLTLAGNDGHWSARFWIRDTNAIEPRTAETVREVGTELTISFAPLQSRREPPGEELERTIEAWGPDIQELFHRLRVVVVGAGNVGAQVGESLARSGFGTVDVLDFDTVKLRNLDRTLHSYRRDALLARSKAFTLTRRLRRSATSKHPQYRHLEWSICEPEGFALAADADIIFSCVDRPWARQVCNWLAYAHLIPVIDGGVDVQRLHEQLGDARIGALMAAPGRKCLCCTGQYDAGHVAADRDGSLDDPEYIKKLPADHHLRRGANVFAFGALAAALEVLQLVLAAAKPSGQTDIGTQLYSLKLGEILRDSGSCHPNCSFNEAYLATGDAGTPPVTGRHPIAENERRTRAAATRHARVRLLHVFDVVTDWLERFLDRCAKRWLERNDRAA